MKQNEWIKINGGKMDCNKEINEGKRMDCNKKKMVDWNDVRSGLQYGNKWRKNEWIAMGK